MDNRTNIQRKFVEFYFIFYVVMDIKVGNTDFYCTKMMVSV